PVEFEHSPLVFLWIVLVLVLDLLKLGLDLPQCDHGLGLLFRQRVKGQSDQDGKKDDGDAGAARDLGQPHQNRLNSRRQPSKKRSKNVQSARLHFLSDRVIASGVPRVTLEQTAHTQISPFEHPVTEERLPRVLRTRGGKTALPRKQG